LATVTAAKLSKDVEFELNDSFGQNTEDYWAVPSRERTPQWVAVFGLRTSDFAVQVCQNSGGSWNSIQSGLSYDSPLSDPDVFFAVPGPTGASFSLAIGLPTNSGGKLAVYSSASSSFGTPVSETGLLGIASESTSSGAATYYFATSVSPTFTLYTSGLTTTPPWPTSSTPLASGSLTATYGWVAYDSTSQIVYLTHHDPDSSGKYQTDKISTSGSLTITASWTRPDRVVAFLTNGKLLTREGGYYNVCDGAGIIQYTFAAGDLKFADEYFDESNTARVAFTQVESTDGSQSGNNLRVRVYSIETSKLDSLK